MSIQRTVVELIPRTGHWRLHPRPQDGDGMQRPVMTREAAERAGTLWFEKRKASSRPY